MPANRKEPISGRLLRHPPLQRFDHSVPLPQGLVLALRDGYPVSRGHSLILPRRHVGSFGEVSLDEQGAMLAMLQRVRAMLAAEMRPDGYKIGINEGAAARPTVV